MIALTDHCVTRFHERVRPTLLRDAARRELEALVDHAELVDDLGWAHNGNVGPYLVISDGIALPVAPNDRGELVATTCITRGGDAEEVRARRNARKAAKRKARATRNRKARTRGRGERRPDPDWKGYE